MRQVLTRAIQLVFIVQALKGQKFELHSCDRYYRMSLYVSSKVAQNVIYLPLTLTIKSVVEIIFIKGRHASSACSLLIDSYLLQLILRWEVFFEGSAESETI